MHHGSMVWAPSQLLAYPAVKKYKKPHPEKKSKVFSQKMKNKGNKKTYPWKIGDVVTVANAVPQPSGHDPESRSAPPSRMDADHCDDAPSQCQSKVLTRRTDTRINKRITNPQEEDHLFSLSPSQRELVSTKPCAHVGSKQLTTPASGQDAVC